MDKIIDVIILSYAKNDTIVEMNNNCINSIINSSDIYKFNILLIETESNRIFDYKQECVKVIQPRIEFNYNKFLNIGLKYCTNEWILISNNDTIYSDKFMDYMIDAHATDNEILSMSPVDDHWVPQNVFDRGIPIHYGYTLKKQIVGWSILLNRKVIDIIGEFDENYSFWYQDDDYIENLKLHKIKHALIIDSKIHHLLSRSNHLVNDFNKMASDSQIYFTNKWRI